MFFTKLIFFVFIIVDERFSSSVTYGVEYKDLSFPSDRQPKPPMIEQSLSGKVAGASGTVTFSRHHIIPYNVIRDFYNRLLNDSQIRGDIVGRFWDALMLQVPYYYYENDVSLNCFTYQREVHNVVTFIANLRTGRLRHGGTSQDRPDGYEGFISLLAWLPGDLFIGPQGTNRSDDAGDGFEAGATQLVGGNYQNVRNIYDWMNQYIRGEDFGDELWKQLVNALIRLVNGRTTPYPFVKKEWTKSGKTTFKIREGRKKDELRKRRIVRHILKERSTNANLMSPQCAALVAYAKNMTRGRTTRYF